MSPVWADSAVFETYDRNETIMVLWSAQLVQYRFLILLPLQVVAVPLLTRMEGPLSQSY